MSSSSKKSERQNDHFWARVCNLLLVDIPGSLLGTATYANDCIISILNLDMLNCMHCQSIVCQNSIARILYAKIPLLEFHMPIVLYAEIPIAEILFSRKIDSSYTMKMLWCLTHKLSSYVGTRNMNVLCGVL